MKCVNGKYLAISCFLFILLTIISEKQVIAQQSVDSITFRIDSAQIVGKQLEYSIMFWRTNKDWSEPARPVQDTALGNVDLYFKFKDGVFDQNKQPLIVRQHAHLNGANDLLNIWCRYHAGLFQIKLDLKTTVPAGMNLVEVPYNTPIELCKVQMPLKKDDRNPEFMWVEVSTGGQSYLGQVLIKTLQGDIFHNPDPALIIEDYSKIEYVCEGSTLKLWAQTYSTGTKQVVTWEMAKEKDYVNAIHFPDIIKGSLVGEGQVHYSNTITTPYGEVDYLISASSLPSGNRVDTLIIPNIQQWMDSMYVQCTLSDESLSVIPKKSGGDDTRVFLRDSIFAWFAASDPNKRADGSTGIGAHDRTDTIFKCPSSESYVSVFFFGPKCNEDINTIGNKMLITYAGRDQLANPWINTVELTSWTKSSVTAPNGRCLYEGVVRLPDSVTNSRIWIDAISTAMGCDNGASYAKYDTVYIRDVEEDTKIMASMKDTTLSSGEVMVLDNKYAYTGYDLITSMGGKLDKTQTPPVYTAPTESCTDPGGCADTIIYYYEVPASKGKCTMEVKQTVKMGDYFYLSPKVYLEGAFYNKTQEMTTNLFDNGLVPHISPYDDKLNVIDFPAGKAIVDWVSITLRKMTDIDDIVASASVFLLKDGTICDSIGHPYVAFKNLNPDEKYYVAVNHRNHLIIRSAGGYKISQSEVAPTSIDFTQVMNVAGGDLKLLAPGLYGMYVGDLLDNGVIGAADQNQLILDSGLNGYTVSDVDFNGEVTGSDRQKLLENTGKGTGLYSK